MHQDAAMLKGFTVPKSPFGQTAFAASGPAAAPDSQRSTNWRCRSPTISDIERASLLTERERSAIYSENALALLPRLNAINEMPKGVNSSQIQVGGAESLSGICSSRREGK
jgi:hypothetical protein